jgi:hypothetical protein
MTTTTATGVRAASPADGAVADPPEPPPQQQPASVPAELLDQQMLVLVGMPDPCSL